MSEVAAAPAKLLAKGCKEAAAIGTEEFHCQTTGSTERRTTRDASGRITGTATKRR